MTSISSSSAYRTSATTSTSSSARSLSALQQQLASGSSSSDTVTISLDALRALLQAQDGQAGGKPPKLTDDQAAHMGADITQQDSDLFTRLDSDQDGVLSADEAEAGKDAIHQAMASGSITLQKPDGAGGGISSSSSDKDAVTISLAALKALLDAAQGDTAGAGGPPKLSNEQAATMGEDIKQQDSDLFTQLDSDQDGVLSADEAEAGKDAIHQAMESGSITLQPPAKPAGGAAPSAGASGADAATSSDDSSELSEAVIQQINILDGQGLSAAEIAKLLGATEAQVQEVLQN